MPSMWDYGRAVGYFSSPRRAASYEAFTGEGRVLLSAPHAVTQMRDGRVKSAERYAGALALLLGEELNCTRIVKTLDLRDDANRDPVSDYRDEVQRLVRDKRIAYVLDLHQLKAERPMALCIGTGRGANITDGGTAVAVAREAFERRGLAPVTIDDPFAALGGHTVCAAAARAGATALLMELNTRLLQPGSGQLAFDDVYSALREIVTSLNKG